MSRAYGTFTISPTPLPDHPSGAAVCFSLNYSKTEEDKTVEWSGSESDFEDKDMGIAVYVRDIPKVYFQGFDAALTLNDQIEDTHLAIRFVTPKSLPSKASTKKDGV